MFQTDPPAFVLGGRFGDSVQVCPCFKAIYDRTGQKPVVICSSEYANVYESVTYVHPFPVQEHWYQGVPKMKRIAEELFGGGIVVQFWQEPPKHEDTIGFNGKGWITVQCHGHEHGVNMALDPDYGTSMARRCGFSREEWLSLPLIFDRRNTVREQKLVDAVVGGDRRPLLLYHFSGISSPFGFIPEVLNPLMQRFGRDFKLVDLGKVQAHRIFDLVAVMERATGMILSDSAPLHLSAATNTPYVACCVGGWTKSVPKGNCVLEITYNDVPRRIEEIMSIVEGWKQPHVSSSSLQLVPAA